MRIDDVWPRRITTPVRIPEWMEHVEDGLCPTADGCMVELDGYCEHGYPSLALEEGLA